MANLKVKVGDISSIEKDLYAIGAESYQHEMMCLRPYTMAGINLKPPGFAL